MKRKKHKEKERQKCILRLTYRWLQKSTSMACGRRGGFEIGYMNPAQTCCVPYFEVALSCLKLSPAPPEHTLARNRWVFWAFHLNTNGKDARAHAGVREDSRGHTFSAKVSPPFLKRRVGVFSTRTPHRPNPIGVSLCRVSVFVLARLGAIGHSSRRRRVKGFLRLGEGGGGGTLTFTVFLAAGLFAR